MSDFVDPDVVRLALADGPDGQKRWIEVKSELTNEEWERLGTSGLGNELQTDGKVKIDWALFKLARMAMWLVDWSLRDGQDKPVPVTPQAIASLRRTTAQEIEAALDAHVRAVEDMGKLPSGVIELAPSSK